MRGVVAVGLVVCASVLVEAAEPFGPFRTARAPVTTDAREWTPPRPDVPSAGFYRFPFLVYQHTLSSLDGPTCAHAPTCSAYGVQAVRRHGPLGFFLATDRLWRGLRSSHLRPLPRWYRGTNLRFFDPLDASDFWLRGLADHGAPEYGPPRVRQ